MKAIPDKAQEGKKVHVSSKHRELITGKDHRATGRIILTGMMLAVVSKIREPIQDSDRKQTELMWVVVSKIKMVTAVVMHMVETVTVQKTEILPTQTEQLLMAEVVE